MPEDTRKPHPKTRFVVLAGPRTGSTAFVLWLNSHARIRCHGEVLLKRVISLDAITHFVEKSQQGYRFDREELAYPNDAGTRRLLHDFLTSLFTNPGHCAPWRSLVGRPDFHPIREFAMEQAVGFKLPYYLLDNRYLGNWLAGDTVNIIHLVRKNVLKQYVSYLAAKQRGLHHSESGVEPVKVMLDTQGLLQMLGRLREQQTSWEKHFAGSGYTKVTYEDFCGRTNELGERLCRFLGVEEGKFNTPSLIKLSPENLAETIENYTAVARILHGTEFAGLLTSPESV